MTVPFRFAICNEIWQTKPLRECCEQARQVGFSGVELAPHTLGEDATRLTVGERQEIRRVIEDAGLSFVGLHWLLMSPPDMHIASADAAVRNRSWEFVRRSVDLCADLANSEAREKGVIVLGSPKQRTAVGEMTPPLAVEILTGELAHLAPHAETRGVTLLIEPLSRAQTNVVNSLAEAVALVEQIHSPAVQTMFDVHNAVDERQPHVELLARYLPHIRHVHVNELDGGEPGMGSYDFGTLLTTLAELGYSGWVSVEAFDFSREPLQIAKRAFDTLLRASEGRAA